ncbi:5'-3' exoribonuclease 2-like [Oscarella lobularis]|uniref:5'-3' exoribonuclease 2-like n=1 Tax=Oscarella lobularis TaxID=121494 RepID=UPI0033141815
MGVPAFFRWLSRKYPSIVVHSYEEKPKEVNGVRIPVDASQENPNGIEFDNLYLDMNGIIHPCSHPEDRPPPKNEDEMMVAIFEYIDRIFAIVRPRRLLYMAIDGVAPRAKMNQQRSRRFRSAQEAIAKEASIEAMRRQLEARGAELPSVKDKSSRFDSNCITPGTKFMSRLARCLEYYVADRLNNDSGWRNIQVILSDASVPGEGEHKIMDFIRKQRASPHHDPNTHHCLCGADADLIMLGLATHEPHFTIIREEFKPQGKKPCEICGQFGHEMSECCGVQRERTDGPPPEPPPEKEFIFIRLSVLREYLEKELRMDGLPFPFDLERAIDDWVFMCFFVGNDFLPHLPSLQIREGAIDRLVRLYKESLSQAGGFLTKNGIVNLKRVQKMLTDLGHMEDGIFKKRQSDEIAFKQRQKEKRRRQKMRHSWSGPKWIPQNQMAPVAIGSKPAPAEGVRRTAADMRIASNYAAAADFRAFLREGTSSLASAPPPAPPPPPAHSSLASTSASQNEGNSEEEEDEVDDGVRLWEEGWRDRYYSNKFGVEAEDEESYDRFRNKVVESYVAGLCWVLRYYYQGCPSWKWFYPFHYAPFASDFLSIDSLPNDFERNSEPFKPLEQLMAVFPAESGQFLPLSWREMMSSPESPIIDFYPTQFKIDLNGKKFAWQGVALLPFVDEKRLFKALESVYSNLTDDERKRNTIGTDYLFIGAKHKSRDFAEALYEQRKGSPTDLDPSLTHGMAGVIVTDAEERCVPKRVVPSPVPGLPAVKYNKVVCVCFKDPWYKPDYIYPAILLPGARPPAKMLKPQDMGYDSRPGSGYRPNVGFHPRRQGSYSESRERSGGQRIASHHVRSAESHNDRMLNRGPYSAMPPPLLPPPSHHRPSEHRDSYSHQPPSYGGGNYSYNYQGGGGASGYNYGGRERDYGGRYGSADQYGYQQYGSADRYGSATRHGSGDRPVDRYGSKRYDSDPARHSYPSAKRDRRY